MAAPAVPFYGKDSDRLAKLAIAHNALMASGTFLDNWPATVATPSQFKNRIDIYRMAFEEAVHMDRRLIAARQLACDSAGATWQKIVNYACATETDNTPLLEAMGVGNTSRRNGSVSAVTDLYAPDLTVVNVDLKGAVRASCSRERRRYTVTVNRTPP